MLSIIRPNDQFVREYLRSCERASFTYDQIGATRHGIAPSGFDFDRVSASLGHGRSVFDAAMEAFRNWQMFPAEMATVLTPTAKIEVGETVAIRFRTPIAWSISPARIVYTIDERKASDELQRFGFAYGTLPGHVERGEERFLLQWNRATDEVTYSLAAFSRPATLLVRLGYAYARYQQARFRRLSVRAMRLATSSHHVGSLKVSNQYHAQDEAGER